MRRQFTMPECDVLYLGTTGLQWEAVCDPSGAQWLLLHGWPVRHAGYNARAVTVALQIPAGYPDTQIDMAYFSPPLSRNDGKGIGALSTMVIDNKSFQRWSRHRTGDAPWRPGEDDVSSHLVLVDDWLERELVKP